MKNWILLFLLSAFLLSGCSGKSVNDASYDLRKDRSAPQFMSNRSVGNNQRHLVEKDVTNQNPNFLNLSGAGSGSESGSNMGLDVDKARQVIRDTKEFKPGSIWINGDRMWVTAYKKGILTERGKIADEARIHRKLVEALPSYNIEVKVQEDRR
ncbi:hypothetical protein [Neobacillus sp. PS3-40]|uniref:hypothetical protein n=1 Tax=Neobacillus sp. PS3-40 TaxID=3070679 RepID=UPI0027E0C85B|nr:hypothetical protein [Neobacillus sp. PS3-40]WML46257.1 hypothetical protein RCG20_10320 [Neobacillus sp. PS3-40]